MSFLKKHINLISIIFLMVIVLSYMKLWFAVDENFTLTLIRYNFKDLLYFDSLDVHPPLYYILLKLFLTLFRGNFLFEVIMSRIFSLLASLIMLVYLKKIAEYFNIFMKYGYYLLVFLVIPNVIGIDNANLSPLLNIRMYALAGMFVVMTMYYIIQFNSTSKGYNLILATIFAECASYTHYYAAFMVGIMLLSYFFYSVKNGDIRKIIKYMISGIIVILGYIPWVIYGMTRQFSDLPYDQPMFKFIVEVVFEIALLVIFLAPFMKLFVKINREKKVDLVIIIITNFIVLFVTSIYSILFHPIFLFRYLYPSIIIIEFISYMYVIKSLIDHNRIFKNKMLQYATVIILVIFFPAFSLVSLTHEIVKVQPISMMILKNDRILNKQNGKYVNVDKVHNYVKPYDINHTMLNYDVQYSMYLRHNKKIPYLKDKKRIKIDNGVPNVVFDNYNIFYKNKK